MSAPERELYTSPNGDRWYLAREPETGRVFVRHKANVPSGGQVTEIDIVRFWAEDGEVPSIKRSCT
jgi:hypothetical protein